MGYDELRKSPCLVGGGNGDVGCLTICRLKYVCAFGDEVVVAVVVAPIPSPRTEVGNGLLCCCCVAACVVCVFLSDCVYTILLMRSFCFIILSLKSGLYAGFNNDQPELAFFPRILRTIMIPASTAATCFVSHCSVCCHISAWDCLPWLVPSSR